MAEQKPKQQKDAPKDSGAKVSDITPVPPQLTDAKCRMCNNDMVVHSGERLCKSCSDLLKEKQVIEQNKNNDKKKSNDKKKDKDKDKDAKKSSDKNKDKDKSKDKNEIKESEDDDNGDVEIVDVDNTKE